MTEGKQSIEELIQELFTFEMFQKSFEVEGQQAHVQLIEAQKIELSAAAKAGGIHNLQPGGAVTEHAARFADCSTKAEACCQMLAELRTQIRAALEAERRQRLRQIDIEIESTRQEAVRLQKEFTTAMARAVFVAIQIYGREEKARRQAAFDVPAADKDFFLSELDRLKAEAGIEGFGPTPADRLGVLENDRNREDKRVGLDDVDRKIEGARKRRG